VESVLSYILTVMFSLVNFFCIVRQVHRAHVCSTGMLSGVCPVWIPRLCLQCIAAPLGGASATVLTTPLDAIRARIQVIMILVASVHTSS